MPHASSMLTVLTLLVSLAGAAAAAGVYKWTDADGKVHFTDKPPPDAAAEKVRVTTGRDAHTAERLDQMKKQADDIFEKRAETETAARESEEEAQKIAAHCASLHDKLQKLRASTRFQTVNDKGEREYLGEERRQEWIRKAEAEIAKHCK